MLEGEYRLEITDESDEDAEEINCNGAEMNQWHPVGDCLLIMMLMFWKVFE